MRSVLSEHAQIKIVGEASDGEAGVAMYRKLRLEVVVVDRRLPRISDFDVIVTAHRPSFSLCNVASYTLIDALNSVME